MRYSQVKLSTLIFQSDQVNMASNRFVELHVYFKSNENIRSDKNLNHTREKENGRHVSFDGWMRSLTVYSKQN